VRAGDAGIRHLPAVKLPLLDERQADLDHGAGAATGSLQQKMVRERNQAQRPEKLHAECDQ
jgi:hypothetical protein